jgi:hypothetical protein
VFYSDGEIEMNEMDGWMCGCVGVDSSWKLGWVIGTSEWLKAWVDELFVERYPLL